MIASNIFYGRRILWPSFDDRCVTHELYLANTSMLIFDWKWKLNRSIFIDVVLFQRWSEVIFFALIYVYHNFSSIANYYQNWFWCQSKFNFVSTMTLTLNQRVDNMTLIQRWYHSGRRYDVILKRRITTLFFVFLERFIL